MQRDCQGIRTSSLADFKTIAVFRQNVQSCFLNAKMASSKAAAAHDPTTPKVLLWCATLIGIFILPDLLLRCDREFHEASSPMITTSDKINTDIEQTQKQRNNN